jgi:hypothetical protein
VGTTVFLANPHRWLYDRLTECAVLDEDVILTESRRNAEVIVYPSPPCRPRGKRPPQDLPPARSSIVLRV